MATIDLVVARVHVAGGLEMTREAPETVRASPGDRLLVKFPYRFDEVSKGSEAWRVRLEARLGDHGPEPEERVFEDRRGIPDDARGFVQQAFDLDEGEHALSFRASAAFREGPWDGSVSEAVEEEIEGSLQVVVQRL